MSNRIAWDAAWIQEYFDQYKSIKDLCVAYNQTHETEYCYRTFKGYCQRKGLRKSNLTAEQDLFLRQAYPKYGSIKTAEMFNDKFGTHKTHKQIRSLAHNRGLSIEDDDIYRECRVRKTCKMKVGECSDGWCEKYVKVAPGKFVRYSRYRWECENGTIPNDHIVIFLDGDHNNNDIWNLCSIPKRYAAKLMRNKLYSSHPALTKAAIMLCELDDRIKEYVR